MDVGKFKITLEKTRSKCCQLGVSDNILYCKSFSQCAVDSRCLINCKVAEFAVRSCVPHQSLFPRPFFFC